MLRCARIKAALGRLVPAKLDLEAALQILRTQPIPSSALKDLAARIDIAKREIDGSEDRAAAIARDFSDQHEGESLALLGARADFDFQRR